MELNNYLNTIDSYFPQAIPISNLISQIISELENRGYHHSRVIPALSVCRDDSLGVLAEYLHESGFPPVFSMKTLTGFPVSGKTAFSAYLHHLQDGEQPGVIIFSPHIGIGLEGELGESKRFGIKSKSKSCGANFAILKHWNENIPIESDDPELQTIEKLLSHHKPQILSQKGNIEKQVKQLVEVEVSEGLHKIKEYCKNARSENTEHDVLLVHGVHIDTPKYRIEGRSIENYFHLRGMEWVDFHTHENL